MTTKKRKCSNLIDLSDEEMNIVYTALKYYLEDFKPVVHIFDKEVGQDLLETFKI